MLVKIVEGVTYSFDDKVAREVSYDLVRSPMNSTSFSKVMKDHGFSQEDIKYYVSRLVGAPNTFGAYYKVLTRDPDSLKWRSMYDVKVDQKLGFDQ